MRVLIASDKFKGSLSAPEACEAIARGILRAHPDAVLDVCPVADGGEGFAAALAGPLAGEWIEAACHDALGRSVMATYLIAGNGSTAVIEAAAASGAWRIAPAERDLPRSHTRGTGELIRHAIEHYPVQRVIVGLGGSATNDGGAGLAAALGVMFLDAAGNVLDPAPQNLAGRLAWIDMSRRVALPAITVACDVSHPLLGPAGATRVFGPQKGADADTIPLLESALTALVEAAHGFANAEVPGAGAAGGLGFGLMQFAGAVLVPGFGLVAEALGLAARVAAADWVITGEGCVDAQTAAGKAPAGVARLAREHGKPVWAFCGVADPAVRATGMFERVADLAACGRPPAELMRHATILLENRVAEEAAGGV